MALILHNHGEVDGLKYFVNKEAPENLILKLFKNYLQPDADDTVAAFTEATFTGYGALTLVGASWGAPTGDEPATIEYGEQTFLSSAAQALQNVYGWYMVRAVSGRVVASERFTNGPYSISNDQDFIAVIPRLTLRGAV